MVIALDWEYLIRDAQQVSQPEGPKKLIAVLEGRNNPFGKEYEDRQQDVSNAHHDDFGVVYSYRYSEQPLSDDDRTIWVDRLAWLLAELEACKKQKPDLATLSVILSISRAFSFDRPLWERLPTNYFSDNLFASMAGFVGSIRCEISSRRQYEPIWEREAVDDFLQADENEDWPRIENKWQTIASAFWPDQDLAEATACLCSAEKGRQALAFAIDQFNSILPIMNVANAMTPHQIGKVAPLLKSGRGRFALVQSLVFNLPRNEALPKKTLESLANLFRDVQQDSTEWRKWMKAFNRYPVRTIALQSAFGMSLANSTIEVKSAYIEAISLSPSRGECREAVADCLVAFAQAAQLAERKELWRLAQERWVNWNFGEGESNGQLTCLAVSELDYGVIGWAVENHNELERKVALENAIGEMNAIANTWYPNLIEYNSAWYRALSKWQIFQHAQQIINNGPKWELPTSAYFPFHPNTDRYIAMTYPANT